VIAIAMPQIDPGRWRQVGDHILGCAAKLRSGDLDLDAAISDAIGHLGALSDVDENAAQLVDALAERLRATTTDALPAMLDVTGAALLTWAQQMQTLDSATRAND
jgi:hypothetical protein